MKKNGLLEQRTRNSAREDDSAATSGRRWPILAFPISGHRAQNPLSNESLIAGRTGRLPGFGKNLLTLVT
jgi:hypothetical protein